ncbi:hypothetical protein NDU88_006430 [Pleurodeles waltl]|uniref:Uncharacterized protein n=1 Tax=Pleurodeles waltl TaxID=8319 RepID=A0AAV7SPL2_PLEWA|nr:hypothetical protein NDU88_006430 [Pleurodeles waltl]
MPKRRPGGARLLVKCKVGDKVSDEKETEQVVAERPEGLTEERGSRSSKQKRVQEATRPRGTTGSQEPWWKTASSRKGPGLELTESVEPARSQEPAWQKSCRPDRSRDMAGVEPAGTQEHSPLKVWSP